MGYKSLEKFIYNNISEAENGISEEKPHYFIKSDSNIANDMKRLEVKLETKIPLELKEFLLNVGSGELFAGLPDECMGQYIFLDIQSILGIYDSDEDIDCLFDSRRELAKEYLLKISSIGFY